MTDFLDKPAPPWRDGAEVPTSFITGLSAVLIERVAPIHPGLTAELAARGLVGVEASPASLRLLGAAFFWIARVPELASILQAVVSEIHLLAADPAYDVSHSEPRWRSSIGSWCRRASALPNAASITAPPRARPRIICRSGRRWKCCERRPLLASPRACPGVHGPAYATPEVFAARWMPEQVRHDDRGVGRNCDKRSPAPG